MGNNEIELMGKVTKSFYYMYNAFGQDFYGVELEVKRSSGTPDYLNCICSDRVIDVSENITGKYINVLGSIRTFNQKDNNGSHLKINVYVEEMEMLDIEGETLGANNGLLEGYICKSLYRTTPLGRNIDDVVLAVNRNYNKSDYIPTIIWGKNAKFVSGLPIGSKIRVMGRLQSREYIKDEKICTAYEFSVQTLEVLEVNEAV